MPYTRAYRLPSPFAAGDQLNAEETATKFRPLLNITPSSNWIQETFYAKDIVTEEIEENGEITTIEFLPIEKTKRPSLYQKFSDLSIRTKLFKITSVVSNPVPNEDTLKRFIEQANGDNVELDKLKTNWEMEIIRAVDNSDINTTIREITEETVYLQAEFFRIFGLESIRLTIFSPDLPTRGDQPVTAIYYSPVADGGIRTPLGESIPFTWTDRSGFLSTMAILPNTIYEIQPVSIELGYEITLLS